jgi:hypothetical protein
MKLAQGEAIFPVHVFGLELSLSAFLDDLGHASGFLGSMLFPCSWIWWPSYILCSATAHIGMVETDVLVISV